MNHEALRKEGGTHRQGRSFRCNYIRIKIIALRNVGLYQRHYTLLYPRTLSVICILAALRT
jgi:hypothetical protein